MLLNLDALGAIYSQQLCVRVRVFGSLCCHVIEMVYNMKQRSCFSWKRGGRGGLAVGHVVLCIQVGRFTQRNQQHCVKGEEAERMLLRFNAMAQGLGSCLRSF